MSPISDICCRLPAHCGQLAPGKTTVGSAQGVQISENHQSTILLCFDFDIITKLLSFLEELLFAVAVR